ncbi:OmpA/MotB domain protein [Geobacter metallireducens RCH3]|uniref:Peptidoglycan-binding outer membrane protein, OMP_b-brl and OmpA domain-containing n=1 Tax=Geobacter metallireducens (strain ATCC 53774 / DSM 7210 / GS-15) TaxID=269799 RepID=Q39YT9_GEOMG|nr:OmpA family protein [Geobacter metallireducens]ABB30585.1 peptidoglycan-binding outer membrane protein, OMP_b-brl and OmpA domain-containing [Geobacter metallireducens GS-15]EHP87971.1 OmpA/MotB domain protein [Geobacter metallireducens RCH3]
MKKQVAITVAAACLAFSATAHSESRIKEGALSVSPFGGYTFFDRDSDLKSRPTGGLRLGYNFTENVAVEGSGAYTDTKYDNGNGSSNVYRYGAELLYHFIPQSRVVPFLAAGLGGITYEGREGVPDADRTDGILTAGGGVKLFLVDRIALRADGRNIFTFNDALNHQEVTAGLDFQFGGGKAAPAPVKAEPKPEPKPEPKKVVATAPLDSDGDGVPDNLDKCPDTPAGVKVDSVGCPLDSDGDGVPDYLDKCPGTPAGVKVDSVGCPLDSDGDGVPDYLDKCPGTPAGVKVDSVGCPLDTDGDGVPDYLDKCPDTPKNAAVDKNGCPEKVCITLKVEFDFDKANIKPEFRDEIKRVADFLKEYPDATAVIEGHTDSKGTVKYNQKLSERRAKAVMKNLVDEFGISAKRLSAKGYGETKPVADNATEEGRQKNRRVVANIDCGLKKRK